MAAMERLNTDPSLDRDGRMHLGFALGRGFDDLARWDEAYRFFAEGNRLKRASIAFSIEDRLAEMARIERMFDSPAKVQSHDKDGLAPIFVVGLPRSGKTTLEHILSRHPQVRGVGEIEALDTAVKAFIADHELDQPGKLLRDIPESAWSALGQHYLSLSGARSDSRRIVDSTPSNFRYVGLIRHALPDAKVIHCRRDETEHLVALYQKFFAAPMYDYTYDPVELRAYRAGYLRLMDLWHRAFAGFVHDVDIRQVAAAPDAEIAQILTFCGLAWDRACLDLRDPERRLGESATFVASASPPERLAPYSAHFAALSL